jgi:hypothetical protein
MRFTAKAQQLKIYRTVWNSASGRDRNIKTGTVNLQLLIYHNVAHAPLDPIFYTEGKSIEKRNLCQQTFMERYIIF